MSRICPNCGKRSTNPNARFCAGCGSSFEAFKTVKAAPPQSPPPPPPPVSAPPPPEQSPARRRIPVWIWIVGAIGVLILSAACGALAVFAADAAGMIDVLPAEEEPLPPTVIPEEPTEPQPTSTLTPVPPSATPTATPTSRPTATPRPSATPRPTSTPQPTATRIPPTAAAPTNPPPPPSNNGMIYLSSETTNNATCRISVWGGGIDFLMDAGVGSPNSREVPAGEYGWQVFFGPSGQTAAMSMNVPAGGACSFTCYDEYVSWGCGY